MVAILSNKQNQLGIRIKLAEMVEQIYGVGGARPAEFPAGHFGEIAGYVDFACKQFRHGFPVRVRCDSVSLQGIFGYRYDQSVEPEASPGFEAKGKMSVMRRIERAPEDSQSHYCALFLELEKLARTFL